ncbi:MAG: hypothetical protein ACJ8AW_03620 [Rhodopila sp.]
MGSPVPSFGQSLILPSSPPLASPLSDSTARDWTQPPCVRIMGSPVQAHDVASPVAPVQPERSGVASRQIEIELPGGSRVRVEEGVSLAALRRVLAALRG